MKNLYFKTLLMLFLCWIGMSATFSQIIGASAYMIGDNVEIGINDAGHEGAPRLVASNNRSNLPIASPVYFGFVANPQLDGWGDYDGDFFTPGTPENGFGIEVDGVNYSNNASGSLEQIPGEITAYTHIGDCITVEWDGTVADVNVHVVYRLVTTELYYTTEITLTNVGTTDLTDVYYYRNLDPDNNVTIGGGYGTQNTIVSQPAPGCGIALVSATQTAPWDSYIGLGAIGDNFRVSHGGFANRNAANIWNGAGGLASVEGATVFADRAISLGYKAPSLAAGVAEKFLYTVVLDASQIDAAIASLYYFDYSGGGLSVVDACAPIVDTARTCPGQPIEMSIAGPSSMDFTWEWTPPVGLSTLVGETTTASPTVNTEYTVTGTSAAFCYATPIVKNILVEVLPVPIIDIVNPGQQCAGFDLTTLVITNLEGSPVDINFYSVVPDSADQVAGLWPSDTIVEGDVVYVMMSNPISGCFDVEPVVIDFGGGADAGMDNASVLCNDGGSVVDLDDLLLGADPGGFWTEITDEIFSGGLNTATGVLNTLDVDAGIYSYEYVALGGGICENDSAIVTITVNEQARAGLDATSGTCNTPGTIVNLNALLVGNNATGTWLETSASGQFNVATGILDASGLDAGDYTFSYTVLALPPCGPDVADFVVTVLPNPVIDAGPDFSICEGGSCLLAADGVGAGGTYAWDGGVSDGIDFTPTATSMYTVTATDASGCMATDDIVVTLNPLPVVYAGADDAICAGDDRVFEGAGAGPGATYVWDGGVVDGVPFEPTETEEYTVIGTDANGCSGSDELMVTFLELPIVVAGDDYEVCYGDEVTLSGDGAGIDGDYAWSEGVEGVPFVPVTTTVYSVVGTDIYGCENSADLTIIVNELPIIEAGADVAVCDGEEMTLTATGAGPTGTYEWTGDELDGEAFIPASSSNYVVTGTDANGCMASDVLSVIVNPLPVIEAGIDQEVCYGDEVTLTGTCAGIVGDFDWDSGVSNGTPFVPLASAVYTVTGEDANGCVNSDNASVVVLTLPIIEAGVDGAVCEGELTILTAVGAGEGGTYTWDAFIENGEPFTPFESAVYNVVGTTIDGCSSTDSVNLNVNPIPDVAFQGDQLIGCAPLTIDFERLTSGATYDWDFGDGTTGTGSSPTHVFTSPGVYDVTLMITSELGCSAIMTYGDYIDIAGDPIASFSFAPDEIDILDTHVEFTNYSEGADYFEWTFGDGETSVEENPTHEYDPASPGNFNVTLTVKNSNGCVDKAVESIEIKDVLLYFIPNAFTPDGNSYNESFMPVFTSGLDIYDYHLMVFNRWGDLVFESFDADYGWNGSFGNKGIVPDDVYIWKIEFAETMSDKKHYVDGHVTVLK